MTSVNQSQVAARLASGRWCWLRWSSMALVLALGSMACGSKTEAERLAASKALLNKQDVSGALIEIKNALDQNPESPRLRALLGAALLRSGNPAAAEIELRRALERNASEDEVLPELARAMLALGETQKVVGQFATKSLPQANSHADLKMTLAAAQAVLGDLEQAKESAAAALVLRPDLAEAAVLMARLTAAGGDTPGALRQLDEVLSREPGDPKAGVLKAEIQLRVRKEPDAALQTLREVIKRHPGSVPARAAVVDILLQQLKVAEARAEFEPLQKLGPRHDETLYLQARLAFEAKDFKTSVEISEQLLARSPNSVRLLALAGAAEYQLRHHALAEGFLTRALRQAPDLLPVRLLLARTHLRAAQPDRALEVLQPVLQSAKADAASLALAGEAYLDAGDSKRSEAAFQRALKSDPKDAALLTSLALAQFARGDVGAALAQLESLSKVEGGVQANLALVSARLQQNDPKGALKAVETLAQKLPDQAQPLHLRGRILQQQGDLAGAAAAFEQALAKEPQHFGANTGLAELDFKAGQPDQARKRLEGLIKAAPRNTAVVLALAGFEARQGAPSGAVAARYREAIKLDKLQPAPHLMLVGHLLASGDPQGAQAAAQDAVALLPNDLAVLDALGLAQMAAGDGQRAVSTFKKLTALQPSRAVHLVRLADAHLVLKDRPSAASALRQAVQIEPDNLLAQRGLALMALQDKRPQDALAIAQVLQKRWPKESHGFALEGEIRGALKNWAAAAAAYNLALQRNSSSELAMRLHQSLLADGKDADAAALVSQWRKSNPSDAGFVFYLGERAAAGKNWSQAEQHFRAVLALQPRHAAAMNNIAWLLATQRQPGAVAMAEGAGALMPDRAPFLDTLALALEAENQLSKAVETQKRAVKLDAKNPLLRLHLAQLLIKKGDKSSARDELDALAKLGPNFPRQADVAALIRSL